MQTHIEKQPKFENPGLFKAIKEHSELVRCGECLYFRPYKEGKGYSEKCGSCQSNHTFNGAFRDSDYCSYGKKK